ncbi:hypothetical protein GUJ93_ZPchr0007g5005 [Zizania palustris]|uniref:Uncharacterized protein n=1 Tax=Zizania palustris TaxID=103762 RepID=A0A8J5W4Q7_ZIZPA|nr:hypothetical protein GUJ93_ZPchr0007g5005 [Zizania palustris]
MNVSRHGNRPSSPTWLPGVDNRQSVENKIEFSRPATGPSKWSDADRVVVVAGRGEFHALSPPAQNQSPSLLLSISNSHGRGIDQTRRRRRIEAPTLLLLTTRKGRRDCHAGIRAYRLQSLIQGGFCSVVCLLALLAKLQHGMLCGQGPKY